MASPLNIADVVHQLKEKEKEQDGTEQDSPNVPQSSQLNNSQIHAHFKSSMGVLTPSMKTGPPRSLSYVYSHPNSPAASRANTKLESSHLKTTNHELDEGDAFPFSENENTPRFRGVLEAGSGSFSSDRKGKKRESRLLDESWNPMKWFHESPREENTPESPFGRKHSALVEPEDDRIGPSLRRANTEEPPASPETQKSSRARWGRLRSLMQIANPGPRGPSVITSQAVNITDELITGGLSTLMLRLWFERDEKGHRRIPVLLHRLRIRVSDSLHPLQGHKSVFRIECEYANGAARWVVYRQLRDFFSLHTHYAVSNAYNRNVEGLPEFPRTSEFFFGVF